MLLSSKKGAQLLPAKAVDSSWWKERPFHPAYQQLVSEVKEEAEKLIHQETPRLTDALFRLFEETGSRKEYEAVYFQKRHRLNTFAVMTLIHPGEKRYKDALHREIEAVCEENTWCLPAHIKNNDVHTIDLFAAETAFALSELRSIVQHDLEPRIQSKIYENVQERVLQPFLQQSFHWETVDHNWAAVCAGSVGAAAMHLLEDDGVLTAILERNRRTMDYFLNGFEEDGVCREGYQYWQYGFGFFVYFADLLGAKTNGRIDLLQDEKVHQISRFQEKVFLYHHIVANFSDCVPGQYVHIGLSHYLHHRFPDVTVPVSSLRPPYAADHCARWAPFIREWIWTDEKLEGEEWKEGDYFLSSSQWVVSRYRSGDNHYAFAAKGGHNDEPHNHNDIGHMIVSRNGRMMLKDLGSGLYQKGYFDEKRYEFITNHALGHSLPVINGKCQVEGRDRKAEETIITSDGAQLVYGLELKKAYSISGLTSFHRQFIWKKGEHPVLDVVDTYELRERPSSLMGQFIMGDLSFREETKGAITTDDMVIHYDPEQMTSRITRDYFMNHFGRKEPYTLLKLYIHEPRETGKMEVTFSFS
ncbi:hypothetical protein [Salibacterium sp. K-3]